MPRFPPVRLSKSIYGEETAIHQDMIVSIPSGATKQIELNDVEDPVLRDKLLFQFLSVRLSKSILKRLRPSMIAFSED